MHPGLHVLPGWKHPVAQIYRRLQADLEQLEINGKPQKVVLVPASLLWLDAEIRYGVDKWYTDPSHGTPLARYASGCLLFTYITGKDPRGSTFQELPRSWNVAPEAPIELVNEEEANWIKDQVWLYYTTGY
jgi:hypothetical protein